MPLLSLRLSRCFHANMRNSGQRSDFNLVKGWPQLGQGSPSSLVCLLVMAGEWIKETPVFSRWVCGVSDRVGSGTPGVIAPTLRTLVLPGMRECVTAPQAVVGSTSSQGGRLEPEKDDAQEPGRHQKK